MTARTRMSQPNARAEETLINVAVGQGRKRKRERGTDLIQMDGA